MHEIHGDEATCVSSMQAEHFLAREPGEAPAAPDAERWTIGGYYLNELVRRGAGWKLRRVKLTVTWSRGNPEVPRLALGRGRERYEGKR